MADGYTTLDLGTGLSATGSAKDWQPGGAGVAFVSGTFDSATVELQARSRPGDDWITFSTYSTPLTSPHMYAFTVPACQLRLKINSAGGSTSITCVVRGFSP